MGPTWPFLLVCGPDEVVVKYWAMLPCNCTCCILGRAPYKKETLLDFRKILGPEKKGLNGVMLGYPTSMNLPRVDELSTDPRDLGRHIFSMCCMLILF